MNDNQTSISRNPGVDTAVVVALHSRRDFTTESAMNPTIERVRELLSFNPTTGEFVWNVRPTPKSRARAGEVAGTVKVINGKLYRYIGIDGRDYLAHQLAVFYVSGVWPKRRIGFVDGSAVNCAISNLTELPGVDERFNLQTSDGRAEYLRAHRAAHPAQYRAKDLKRKFNITAEEYRQMLDAQNGVCAICEKPETSTYAGTIRNLAVDHDHATGKIRGLLCAHCNHTLGKMGDSAALLRRAADYLERHLPQTVVAFAAPMKDTA